MLPVCEDGEEDLKVKKVTAYIDTVLRGKMDEGIGVYNFVCEYVASNGVMYTTEEIGAYKNTTNNRIAIIATIRALEKLKSPCDIDIFINSNYVAETMKKKRYIKWMEKGWEKVKNRDLWERLIALDRKNVVKYEYLKTNSYTEYMRSQIQKNLTTLNYKEDKGSDS